MKKLGLFFVFILAFAELSLAQLQRGALQIRLRNNKMLTLILDGRHFRKYGASITIADLPQGMHELKVYSFYPAADPKYRDLRDNKAHAILLYKGRIHIDGGKMYYYIVDEAYKSMSIRESRTVSIDNSESNFPINTQTLFSDEKDDYSYDDINNWDDNRQDGRDNVGSYYNGKNRLTTTQLLTLKTSVEDRMSSSDKEEIIAQYLENKTMMTEQVIEIMSWLTFESSKLVVAKNCLNKVLDQENYLLVSKALTFQSSKRELASLIFDQNNKDKRAEDKEWDSRENDKYGRDNLNKTEPLFGVLKEAQINKIEESVSKINGDSEKKRMMIQYLEKSKMTSSQVSKIMDWFSFEGTKLEFAKWSFDKVTDKDNFGQVKNKFRFSSSKKAIDELIFLMK